MRKNAFRVVTILLLFTAIVCDRTSIQLGEKVSGSKDGKYSVIVPIKDPNAMLFVKATGANSYVSSSPMVTLSKDDDIYDCDEIPPISLCVISSKLFNENDEFKIDVTCLEDCHYDLVAYQSRDYEMQIDEDVSLIFQNDSDRFEAKVVVPGDLNYTELDILVYLNNPEEVNGTLSLFVNAGNNVVRPTADSFNYKGEPIWNDGLGVFLDTSKVKPKDNIQILVTGSTDMEVTVSVFSIRQNLRDVDPYQKVYDNVGKNKTKLYLLNLTGVPSLENSDVYVKLTQYSGKTRILVSPDKNFKLSSSVQGASALSVTQVSISPKIRNDLGFGDIYYIAVSGDYESTYLFEVTMEDSSFTIIDSQVAQMSAITGKEVDNYLYPFIQFAEDSDDFLKQFTIGLEFYTDASLQFKVRRCSSYQEAGSKNCLIKDVDDYNSQKESFNDIVGDKHSSSSLHFFNFRYDVRKCTKLSEHSYKCVLQVIVFNKQNVEDANSYVITLEQSGDQINLLQSVPKRNRIVQAQSQRYYFSLSNTEDVESVTFYLTVVSGDCVMLGSRETRDVEVGNPGVQIAMNDTLKFTGDISKAYYIKIQAYTISYYTLTAVVKRKGDISNRLYDPSKAPLRLIEGLAQLYATDDRTDLYFYINLGSEKGFYVQTSTNKGDISFEVRPSNKYAPLPKTVWRSEDGQAHVSNENDSYSDGNEFIVIVHSQQQSIFSIVYNKEGNCGLFNLGQAVVADLDETDSRCFSFHLTRAQDVEIVIATSYFEMSTGNLFVVVGLGQEYKRQLSQRITVIKAQELIDECPDLTSIKGNSSQCILQVNVTALKDEEATLVVQYISDEMEVFDGLPQPSQGDLSVTRGRFFYYAIDSNKPLVISLKSQSSNKYRILAKIVGWEEYINSSSTIIYPMYLQEEYPHADTAEIGTTALILKDSYFSQFLKTSSVLLIAVYANSPTEVATNFNIEIMQKVAKLRLSQSKQGFVDTFERKRYKIEADGKKELLVHMNSYQLLCAKLELYSLNNDDNSKNQKPIISSLSGELIITPTQMPQSYAVQVTGISPCGYEISYSPIDERVYQLLHGLLFSIELKPQQSAYFMYFNSRNESFRIVSMSEYGQVQIKAKSLKQLTDVSEVIKNNRYEFGGAVQGGALLIPSSSPYFCTNCYFLFEISTVEAASTSLIVHSLQTPVSLRENRLLRETLNSSLPQVTYALLKLTPFKISTTVLYGTPSLTVTNTVDKTFSINSTLTDSQTIDVPYSQVPTGDSQYENAAFLINMKCPDACSFTMVLDVKSFARRMVEGLPNTVTVNSSKTGACVQFLSLEKDSSTYMHVSTTNISNLKYDVKCYNKQTFTECGIPGGKYVIGVDKNKENLNIQLKSIRGYYHFCLLLIDQTYPLNATLMHSENIGMRYITANTINLMNSNHDDPPATIEMYNPKRHPVLVEVFQCSGQVNFEATEDYKKFMSNQTSIAEHSKTAGHYVVRFDSTGEDSTMVFARIKAKNVTGAPDATYILTYSFFEPNKYPYAALGAEDTSIYYDYSKKFVTFKVKTIQPNDQYRILSYVYKIYLSKDQNAIKAAVQCQTANVFTRSIRIGPNDAATTDWVSFEISNSDIKEVMGKDTKYYFVSVSCAVQVVDAESETSGGVDTYRFIYDNLQLSSRNPAKGMGTFKMKTKFVFLWVMFPLLIGIITFYIALRYCFKRVRGIPHSELMEEDPGDNPAGETNFTNPTTSGHLVGVSTTVVPARRLDQN